MILLGFYQGRYMGRWKVGGTNLSLILVSSREFSFKFKKEQQFTRALSTRTMAQLTVLTTAEAERRTKRKRQKQKGDATHYERREKPETSEKVHSHTVHDTM